MKFIKLFNIYCLYIFFVCSNVYAAWIGPTQVLTGGWGNGLNEFNKEGNPPYAILPILYDISSTNQIVVTDKLNGRIKIYYPDGVLIRNITPPVTNPKRWSMKPEFIGQNILIPLDKYYIYSNTGDLVSQASGPDDDNYLKEHNGKLYVQEIAPSKKWLVYSPDGVLLNTHTEKPLELGHISDHVFGFQGQKMHRTTVMFPDKNWEIVNSIGPCNEFSYIKDNSSNLYCVSDKHIQRYSACGKIVSEFTVPDDIVNKEDMGPGIEPYITTIEAYGNIEMADNGDIYTSKVTPTNFSVIKWTWQASPDDKVGGPDAPTDFAANVLGNEVKLAWRPSLQDPGCVSGYEISRATVSGGPYTVLTTTGAGVKTYTDTTVETGNTYYYKVRALSAVADSDYTPEQTASIP